jgi:hypothetical protein
MGGAPRWEGMGGARWDRRAAGCRLSSRRRRAELPPDRAAHPARGPRPLWHLLRRYPVQGGSLSPVCFSRVLSIGANNAQITVARQPRKALAPEARKRTQDLQKHTHRGPGAPGAMDLIVSGPAGGGLSLWGAQAPLAL